MTLIQPGSLSVPNTTSPGGAAGDDPLLDSLVAFTGCIGNAFTDVCSYGLTYGDSYVPFDPDPEDDCTDDEVLCSQVWVRVMNVQPAPGGSESWAGDCATQLKMELEVGVLRCVDIPPHGEAPRASDALSAALQAMVDMRTIYQAAMTCEPGWDAIYAGSWSPHGPLGGQYGGIWTFHVDIDTKSPC